MCKYILNQYKKKNILKKAMIKNNQFLQKLRNHSEINDLLNQQKNNSENKFKLKNINKKIFYLFYIQKQFQ